MGGGAVRGGPGARGRRSRHGGGVRGGRPRPRQGDLHLSYRYAPGDTGLSWVTKEARGAIRDIRGEYLLNEVSGSETDVTYRLAVEIGILVPGFVRTEGAKRVIENALERLKRRVEMG